MSFNILDFIVLYESLGMYVCIYVCMYVCMYCLWIVQTFHLSILVKFSFIIIISKVLIWTLRFGILLSCLVRFLSISMDGMLSSLRLPPCDNGHSISCACFTLFIKIWNIPLAPTLGSLLLVETKS